MVWPGPSSLRQPDGAGNVDAGRAAEAQPFLLEQIEDDRQRFLVGDLAGVVDGARLRDCAVMRPWPMPSVIELPSAFELARGVAAVKRGAHADRPARS